MATNLARPSIRSRAVADQKGSISILAALTLTLCLVASAFAVDLGSLYVECRTMQGAVDLAAMAAATDLEHARSAAVATLRANGMSDGQAIDVVTGRYERNPALPPDRRFVANATPANAARVTLRRSGTLHFAKSFTREPVSLRVEGMATNTAQAIFSVGSRLAAVRDGLPNQLLSSLLGGSVNLSVMDYDALLSGSIKVFDLFPALASELNLQAGTYNDVLISNATLAQILNAAASVADHDGNARLGAALRTLKGQSSAGQFSLPLSRVIDLGPLSQLAIGEPAPGLDAGLNVLDLVTSSAAVANGRHQVALNLGASVPGLAKVTVDLAIGEPAQVSSWVSVGQKGSVVRTVQKRLRVVAEVGGSGLLAGAKIKLPIAIDTAFAEGRLADVTCQPEKVSIAARPGIAEAWIGDVPSGFADFSRPLSVGNGAIVDLAPIKVTGGVHVSASNVSEQTLEFDRHDIAGNVAKTVGTRDALASVASSLVRDLSLNVSVLGLGLTPPAAIRTLVAQTLATAAAPVDSLVSTLLATLGVHLGEADVRVHGVRCGGAVLSG